ncbi:Hypothetical protein FKW44_001452 [Caligus rogercresseyi]|uniref:Uncharacterized protein n=1 Tax=Caligus rogercresseyi TaxID=217165 RepID=A0A7T8KIR7_CALRO|nr:Hypothetical protein FKW44_001452 [Caligus rogercresseyi]
MAKEECMSTINIWRLVRKDLRMFPLKKKPHQIMPQAIMNKPLIRGRKNFNSSLKTGPISFLDR